MLWGNTAYCENFEKSSGENSLRYSVKISWFKRMSVILLRKLRQSLTFLRACHTSWQENSWHSRYAMKKLRHCHPMYSYSTSVTFGAVLFSPPFVCLSLCLSAFWQDYSENFGWLFVKFGKDVDCGSDKSVLFIFWK